MLPQPPGPRALPLIGNLHQIADRHAPHIAMSRAAKPYGDVVQLRMGSLPIVLLAHPDVIAEACDRDELSDRWVTGALSFLSPAPGMVFADYGEDWYELSKFTQAQMFSIPDVIALSHDHFVPTIDETIERFGRLGDQGTAVSLHKEMFTSAFNLTFRSLWGSDDAETDDFTRNRGELHERVAWFESAVSTPSVAAIFPRLSFLENGKTRRGKAERARRDELIGWFVQRAAERRERGETGTRCWVDLMLDREDAGTSRREVTHALCMDMLGAIPSGVAAASTWSLLLIANRPEVQAKVHEELDNVLGPEGATPTEDHRSQLPYTFACVAESLRYRTVAPNGIPHRANRDTEIGGFRIAEGSNIIMNSWAIHRDERFWDSPKEYRPERFLPEDEGSPPSALTNPGYIPFGVGNRRCTGDHFAVSAIWLHTVRLLHRLRLETPDGKPLPEKEKWGLSTAPFPFEIRVTRR